MLVFYYLRIIKVIYFDNEVEKYDTNHSIGLKLSLIIATVLILTYFIYPNSLIDFVSKIDLVWWGLKNFIIKNNKLTITEVNTWLFIYIKK